MAHVLRALAAVAQAPCPAPPTRPCCAALVLFERAAASAPCALLRLSTHMHAVVLHASACPSTCEGALGALGEAALAALIACLDAGASYAALLRALAAALSAAGVGMPTGAQLAPVEDALAALSLPLHVLLCTGGDDRLHPSRSAGNRYGAHYHAVDDEELLQRSSCTASSPSLAASIAAEKRRFYLLAKLVEKQVSAVQLNEQEAEAVRAAILQFLLLPPTTSCVLAPSGTDALLLVTSLVYAEIDPERSGSVPPPIVSVVCGDGELGGGSAAACLMTYFTQRTPSGVSRVLDTPLEGAPLGAFLIRTFPPRTHDGRPWNYSEESQAEIEATIARVVEEALAQGQRPVLHTVICSKTGLCMPSLSFLRQLKARHGHHLAVVADFCQLRNGHADIVAALALDAYVIITGSKFLGGPAFSGAVLTRTTRTILPALISPGLSEFLSGFNVDACSALRTKLPCWCNLGLLFRWWMALAEGETLSTVSNDARCHALAWWRSEMREVVAASRSLEILEESAEASILAFRVRKDGRYLGMAELREVYSLLRDDVSAYVPEQKRALAKMPVHIGQPVPLGSDVAALRVALSARHISSLVHCPDMACEALIVAKVQLILDHVVTYPTPQLRQQ